MGEASTAGEQGDGEGHGTPMGVVIGLNTAVNALINAGFGLGLAWLHWQDYEIAWYAHELHGAFELGFVVGDLLVQGLSVGLIVTLIVAAILHRQWDADHLAPGSIDRFLLDEERTRGRHLAAWAGGMALMGFTVSVGIVALLASTEGEVAGLTFAVARTVNGVLVGGLAGGLVTASWVTNLSAGRLVTAEGPATVVARTMQRAAGRPLVVLAGVAVLTAGLGVGAGDLTANVNASDEMPRSTEDHEGALALEEEFNGTHELGFTWHFRTDPEQCRADNDEQLAARSPADVACANISDEVYVRAMEEAYTFLADHSFEPEGGALVEDEDTIRSPVEAQRGLPGFLKLANWTIAGGEGQASEDAYALPAPEDRVRTNGAEELAWDRMAPAEQATMNGDASQAVVTYQVDPETELTSREIGAFALDARDAYVDWAEQSGNWQVFTGDNEPRVTVDRPVANAHQAQALDADLGEVLGVLGAGLAIGAAVVFRDPLAAGLATATVAVAGLWTFGALGHAGVPLSELDLVHAPLVVAAGVLFTVPAIEAFLREDETGTEPETAIGTVGDEVVAPLSLGGYVAAAGLAALGLSPTAMAADAAWMVLVGLTAALVLTLTLVPAGLSLIQARGRLVGSPETSRSTASAGLASRGVAAAVAVALTVASLAAVGGLAADAWGQPVETWPEEDERRAEHERAVLGFHDREPGETGFAGNAIVVHGEVTHPGALGYVDRLTTELRDEANGTEVLAADASRGLPSVIRDWMEMCCGASGVAESELPDAVTGETDGPVPSYPSTQSEVETTVAAMLDSPYAPVARPVVAGPPGDALVVPIAVETGDAAEASEGWEAVTSAVEAAEPEKPNDVETAVVGPTANAHLTSEDQVHWLFYLLAAGTATAGLLALGYTREVAGTLAVALSVGLAGIWTLGLVAASDVAFTVATAPGLVLGLLAAGGFAARRAWPASRGRGRRASLFGVVLLVGVLAGVAALLDVSAGFPSPIAQDGIQVAVAGLVAGYAAQALVGRALVPGQAAEPERTRVVEAEAEPVEAG
jgi:hypothetical protein